MSTVPGGALSKVETAVLIDQFERRGLPVPPDLKTWYVNAEMAERGINPYPTFADFVKAVNPTLMDYEHIPTLVNVAERIVWGKLKHVLVLCCTQYFKALADDTPIATPTGWCMLGDLKIGDIVFAGDGTPTRVGAVRNRGVRPTHWVAAEDGGGVRAADDHAWEVVLPNGGGRMNHTTKELAEVGVMVRYQGRGEYRRRSVRIPPPGSLDAPDADLPIPPYTLGAWLGDGTSRGASITIGEARDRSEIVARIEADGFVMRPQKDPKGFGILGAGGPYDRATSLNGKLRRCGLVLNKHVPERYFWASRSQRLSLLQGLMDTDGTVAKRSGRSCFNSTNERLAKDVQRLVWTLGTKAFLSEHSARLDGEDAGPYWFVSFYLEDAAHLRRKASLCRKGDGWQNKWARAVTFEKMESCAVTCIAVEHPSGLFLAGRNLMVTHNSEIFSRLLPAYYLLTHQNHLVALGSYAADIAWEFSETARDYYARVGGRFKNEFIGKVRSWATPTKGGMWATGIAGQWLGHGYNLGIVDDPVDPMQALSATYQRRFARWWPSMWLRGQRPGAAMVFIMQRLGVEDPVEYLFLRELGRGAEDWHVVVMDEVRSAEPFGRWSGPRGLPPTCTLEPDPRPIGAVLAPSWRDEEEVARMQRTDPITVAAQRQQRPMMPTGDFWKLEYFEKRIYDELPKDAYDGGKDWDTAQTKEDHNSASAFVESYRGPSKPDKPNDFDIYINDVGWRWVEYPALIEWMLALDGPHYVEDKSSGKSAVQSLAAYDVKVYPIPVLGDKLARASAAQPSAASGRVWIRREVYQMLLYGEQQGLLRVTAEGLREGAHGLDLNDAFVQAIHRHTGIGRKRRRKVTIGL